MATKRPPKKVRKVVTSYEEDEEQQPPNVPWEEENQQDFQVQSILDSIGPGDIKIKILKWGPKGKSYCFSLDGGPVDEDFIQQQYGGGRYQGQIFRNGIYTGNSFELNIAERLATAPGASGGMADIQTRMMQQQIDFLKDIILQRGQQQQTPVGELAEAVKSVHALSGGGQAGLGEKAVELLLKGFELGKSISSKEENWSDVVREALPVVGELMQQRNGLQQTQQSGQAQQRNQLPVQDHSVMIRQGIAYLKGKAITGRDPLLYVDLLVDNADEPQYQPVLHFVLTSEFSAFEQFDPDLSKSPFSEWFRAVYDGLRQAFSQQNQVDVDTGGASGDGGNTGNNGAAGKTGSKGAKAVG